jgi:hypothetical protein
MPSDEGGPAHFLERKNIEKKLKAFLSKTSDIECNYAAKEKLAKKEVEIGTQLEDHLTASQLDILLGCLKTRPEERFSIKELRYHVAFIECRPETVKHLGLNLQKIWFPPAVIKEAHLQ